MTEPAARLAELANGYMVSQAIHVAAVLAIADRLRDGPRPVDDLAAECWSRRAVASAPPMSSRHCSRARGCA